MKKSFFVVLLLVLIFCSNVLSTDLSAAIESMINQIKAGLNGQVWNGTYVTADNCLITYSTCYVLEDDGYHGYTYYSRHVYDLADAQDLYNLALASSPQRCNKVGSEQMYIITLKVYNDICPPHQQELANQPATENKKTSTSRAARLERPRGLRFSDIEGKQTQTINPTNMPASSDAEQQTTQSPFANYNQLLPKNKQILLMALIGAIIIFLIYLAKKRGRTPVAS